MFGIVHFETFIIAAILLNLTPGADTMYILSRSIANGKKAGIFSALGISTGSLVHTLFAALGLSVLLAESQMAFNIVKYIGAAYLIYLGIKSISSKKDKFEIGKDIKPQKDMRIYASGILTNIFNPKVALFFLAFLPQFINPDYSDHFISFVVLGLIFITTGTIWCLVLAIFSAKLSERIRRNYQIKIWLDRITGIVFVGLRIKIALSER